MARSTTLALSNPTPFTDVPSGWQIARIEDVCSKVTSGGTPSRANQDFYRNGTIDWYKTGELKDGWLEGSEEKITPEAVASSSAKVFPPKTVLLALYGDGKTITSLGVLRRPGATNQACCAMIVDPVICDHRFLFYSLKLHRQDLIFIASGGAQRNLSGKLIRDFGIRLPSLPEQRAIAGVLGALDDKIEVNRKTARVLEGIARAVFTSWFVDFDPVRRHPHAPHAAASHPGSAAARRAPGPAPLPADLAALFPTRLVNSPIGEVPEGWRVGTLASVCNQITSGGTPDTQRSEFWGGGIPWLSSGETREKFVTITEKTISKEGVANSSTRLVPKYCTVIASAGQGHTRGQTSLLLLDTYINQSVVALIANPAVVSDFFLFFDLERRYEEFRRVSDSFSSRGSLTTKLLAGLTVITPPLPVVREFDAFVTPIVARLGQATRDSATLAALRDALLPKLISGELRIADAEKIVGRAIHG